MNTVLFMLQNTFQNTKETIALLAFLSCLHFYKYGSHGQEQKCSIPPQADRNTSISCLYKIGKSGFLLKERKKPHQLEYFIRLQLKLVQ